MQRRSFDMVDNLIGFYYYDFMLTKNDLQQIKSVVDDSLQPLKTDVSGLKQDVSDLKKDTSSLKLNVLTLRTDLLMLKSDVSTLKTDVSSLKQDLATVKTDFSLIKADVRSVKDKIDELYDFSVHGIGDILDWTNEIHRTIVKKKLPERVERLEKHAGIPLANCAFSPSGARISSVTETVLSKPNNC